MVTILFSVDSPDIPVKLVALGNSSEKYLEFKSM